MDSWSMRGELVLSCNCTVFCPCVLSLGNRPPTEGYCRTWAGFRDRESDTVISNSEYWIAPEIIVAKSDKSRLRAFGRNWNFAGRSAEICKLDWRGP